MRRVIILICLVAVLACMAVPAFAVGHGNGKVYWAPINFDRIHFDGIGQFDYPFNWIDTFSSVDNPALFTFEDPSCPISGEAYFSQDVYSSSFVADFLCPATRFDIRADSVFCQPADLASSNYIIWELNHYNFKKVTISFNLYHFNENSLTQKFSLDFKSMSSEFVDQDYGVIISDLITDMIYGCSWWSEDMVVAFLTNLRIDFEIEVPDEAFDTPHLMFTWNGSQISEENDARIFMVQSGPFYSAPQPTPEVPEIDIGTWLRDTVGSFLDFEIFPGFSVDMIFYLILVICIVLWFVKIIS